MKQTLSIILLLAVVAIAGCGGGGQPPASTPLNPPPQTFTPRPPTPNPYFSEAMVGQTWRFRNGYGDETDIEIQKGPDNVGCTVGPTVIWHYTKTADRAYWQPGFHGAELWFVLLHDGPDWRSVASVINWPLGNFFGHPATQITLDPLPYDGTPPYIVVPQVGEVHETSYRTDWDFTRERYDCIPTLDNPTPVGLTSWKDTGVATTVDTPIYTGAAIISEQWEACTQAPTVCAHERWWFAPGIGLVKVEVVNPNAARDGGPVDPNITMTRFQ